MLSKSDIAVSVRGLSKSYTIAHDQEKHVTLAETMLARLKDPLRRPRTETFWALKDIDFDIKKGDVVGIIGRNGAGKSTLLKILSRITEPTSGQIDLYGRVGSLLEVGTGFHPELTGRENIFLNGAILGMSKGEIKKQFDAIVDFAGVERFLDTPVKRYSSGMYVRLAFAVAAHLRSEILIVDEVLAVGDSEFQRKCMGKMRDVSSDGRTVIFVSHNMAAIANLCSRLFLLQAGAVTHHGRVAEVLSAYQNSVIGTAVRTSLSARRDRSGSGRVRITGFRLEDSSGTSIDRVFSGQDFAIVLAYAARDGLAGARVDAGISIGRGDHDLLSVMYSSYDGVSLVGLPLNGEIRCALNDLPLAAGTYKVGARILVDSVEADWPRDGVAELVVENGDFFRTGSRGHGSEAPLLMRAGWAFNPSRLESACT